MSIRCKLGWHRWLCSQMHGRTDGAFVAAAWCIRCGAERTYCSLPLLPGNNTARPEPEDDGGKKTKVHTQRDNARELKRRRDLAEFERTTKLGLVD